MYRKGDHSIFHFVLESEKLDVNKYFSERIGVHILSLIFQICPGLTLIRCMRISISVTKCPLALLANFNITRVSEYTQFTSQSVPQMLLLK